LGLEKPNSGLDRGETFFPNSGSDLDSDETFQISRNVGLDIDEIVCLLDSQLWVQTLQDFILSLYATALHGSILSLQRS
jgi:hypothetical protein